MAKSSVGRQYERKAQAVGNGKPAGRRKSPAGSSLWRNRIVGEAEVLANELTANPRNWRTHGDQQRAALDGVLSEVGWVQRVIVNQTSGHIVDGHARVEQAAKRGERVPVVYVELTEREEALVLATLDPLGAMAGKDEDMLRELVADIGDLRVAGIDDLLRAITPPEAHIGLTDPDEAPPAPADPVTRPGDLWLLGDHRLVCGDSTDAATVGRLLGGVKPEIVLTDPPYNVDFDYGDMTDDDKPQAEYLAWTLRWFSIARVVPRSCAVLTIGITNLPMWVSFVERTHRIIAWVKENQCSRNYIGKTSGFNTWEPVLVYGKAKKCVARDSFSIPIHIQPDTGGHPCPKSIKAWRWLVDAFTDGRDCIFDPFLGSGTTIIAAEMEGRICYGLELEPKYCDVIVQRWQAFTGQEAVLDGDGRAFGHVADSRRAESGAGVFICAPGGPECEAVAQ